LPELTENEFSSTTLMIFSAQTFDAGCDDGVDAFLTIGLALFPCVLQGPVG